jgi:hypothetical protein
VDVHGLVSAHRGSGKNQGKKRQGGKGKGKSDKPAQPDKEATA